MNRWWRFISGIPCYRIIMDTDLDNVNSSNGLVICSCHYHLQLIDGVKAGRDKETCSKTHSSVKYMYIRIGADIYSSFFFFVSCKNLQHWYFKFPQTRQWFQNILIWLEWSWPENKVKCFKLIFFCHKSFLS